MIVLVGLPGSGKSTVGPQLAKFAGWGFFDLDASIEQHSGMSIWKLFKTYGESTFRTIESDLLATALNTPAQIVATGGGVVLADINRIALRRTNSCVYLHVEPSTLAARLQGDTKRPLFQGNVDIRIRTEELYAQRDHLYREVATLVLEATKLTKRQVVDDIAAKFIKNRF